MEELFYQYRLIECIENQDKDFTEKLEKELSYNDTFVKALSANHYIVPPPDARNEHIDKIINNRSNTLTSRDVFKIGDGIQSSLIVFQNAILLQLDSDTSLPVANENIRNLKKVIPRHYVVEFETKQSTDDAYKVLIELKKQSWLVEVEIVRDYLQFRDDFDKLNFYNTEGIDFKNDGLVGDQPLTFYEKYLRALELINNPKKKPDYSKVVVGILDYGVDVESEALKKSFKADSSADFSMSGTNLPENGMIHGTMCAGIIGANYNKNGFDYLGIAPEIPLLNAKIFKNGPITHDLITVLKGIYWVYEIKKCRILSCSWHDTHASQILSNYISFCSDPERIDGGAIFIFAAGNKGKPLSGVAQLEHVIAVGAVDGKGNPIIKRDHFGFETNHSSEIATSAVGEYILSIDNAISRSQNETGTRTPSGFSIGNGTSIAVPQVSAAVALMLAMEPSLKSNIVKQIISKKNSKPPPWNTHYGQGILNISNSLSN